MKKQITKKPKRIVKKTTPSSGNPRYIQDYNKLSIVVESLRNLGYRIVLTQGVYDLIHEGHARYLEIAKSHGDILIVGIDSDALTKERKGPNRPIVPQKERIEMLLHLRHVDYVALRDTDRDIGDLIRTVKPDVLITSSSTKDFSKQLTNQYRKFSGKIIILPAQSTTSTTARIRQLSIDGASSLAAEVNKLTQEFIEKIRGA